MKEAIQVNIKDRLFHIDQDAFDLLKNYLDQLSATFPDEEGQEIVSDIETRVSELFDERRAAGYNVIDIEYVTGVIDIMGHPEELNEDAPHEPASTATATPPPYTGLTDSETSKKKLYRDIDNKMLGGVISGLARYLGWDATIMRILVVIVALSTYIWPCLLCYLVAWMVIPPADTPRRRLEMCGHEVNVSNVGKNIKNSTLPPSTDPTRSLLGVLGGIIGISFKIIIGIMGVVAAGAAAASVIGLIFMLFFLIGFAIIGVGGMSAAMSMEFTSVAAWQCAWWALMCVFVLLLGITFFWIAGSVIFNWKGARRSTIWAAVIVGVLTLAASLIVLFFLLSQNFDPAPFVIFD